jgi:hypothetical protein
MNQLNILPIIQESYLILQDLPLHEKSLPSTLSLCDKNLFEAFLNGETLYQTITIQTHNSATLSSKKELEEAQAIISCGQKLSSTIHESFGDLSDKIYSDQDIEAFLDQMSTSPLVTLFDLDQFFQDLITRKQIDLHQFKRAQEKYPFSFLKPKIDQAAQKLFEVSFWKQLLTHYIKDKGQLIIFGPTSLNPFENGEFIDTILCGPYVVQEALANETTKIWLIIKE